MQQAEVCLCCACSGAGGKAQRGRALPTLGVQQLGRSQLQARRWALPFTPQHPGLCWDVTKGIKTSDQRSYNNEKVKN